MRVRACGLRADMVHRFRDNDVKCTFFVTHEWSGIATYMQQNNYPTLTARPIFVDIIHGASQWAESWSGFAISQKPHAPPTP